MAAALLWVRSNLRSQWRSAALVVLMAGLCGGTAMAAVAGSRRTTTAFTRFVEDSKEPQVFVAAPDAETAAVAAAVMRRAVDADHVGLAVGLAAVPAKADRSGQIEISVLGGLDGLDDTVGQELWRPKVVAGELANGPDDVNVNELLAGALGLRTGDRMPMVGYSPKLYEACANTGGACTPDVDLGEVIIRGILRRPDDISPDSYGAMNIELSPALTARWRPRLATRISIAGVRVDDKVDRAALGKAITAAIGPERLEGETADVFLETDSTGDPEKTSGALDVEHNGLLMVALLAGLSGLIAVPQALARLQAPTVADHERMRALGATRRDRRVAVSVVSLGIGAAGAAAAAVVAVAASPLLPIGLARRAEPSIGLHADWSVLCTGAVLTVVVISCAGVVEDLVTRDRPRFSRTSRLSRFFATSRPVPGMAGRLLFEGGRFSRVARTALMSGIIGVAVIAAAVTVTDSQAALVRRPALFGAPWDLQGIVRTSDPAALDALRANPRVEAAAVLHSGRIKIGPGDIAAVGIESLRGTLEPTLLDGRTVRGGGEIVLSASVMDRLDLRVGDRVEVGSDASRGSMTVVGRGVPIAVGIYSSDEGAIVSAQDFDKVAFQNEIAGEGGVEVAVRAVPGTNLSALRADLASVTGGFDRVIADSFRPARISNIERVRSVPHMVIGFAALLTALVLVHALAVVAQRRRRDLAVLRALGLRRREAGLVIAWHGLILAGLAVVVGVPVGLIAGRLLWRVIATGVSAVYEPHVPVLGLLTLVVATLAGGLGAGAALGRRGTPRALARLLRSE